MAFGSIFDRRRRRRRPPARATVVVVGLLLAIVSFVADGLTSYVPNELVANFDVPVLDGPHNLEIVSGGSDVFPLLVVVTNLKKDPWSAATLLAPDSVLAFLRSDFATGNVHYLFLPLDDLADAVAVQQALYAGVTVHGGDGSGRRLGRLFFANTTFAELHSDPAASARGLTGPLSAWRTSVAYMQLTAPSTPPLNVTRLDCYWPYCFGPSSGDGGFLVDVGDACATALLPDTAIDALLPKGAHWNQSYLLAAAPNCSYESAAAAAQYLGRSRGVRGAVVAMRADEPYSREINADASANLERNFAVTAVGHAGAGELRDAVRAAQAAGAPARVRFLSEPLPAGYFLVIDR
jgi:hypothetical protein